MQSLMRCTFSIVPGPDAAVLAHEEHLQPAYPRPSRLLGLPLAPCLLIPNSADIALP